MGDEAMNVQVRSMTEAVRIKQMLAAKGITAKVIQTPLSMRQGGCGYSLVIRPEALEEAEKAALATKSRILSVQRGGRG